MTYTVDKSTEQRFLQVGMTWEQFKTLEGVFADSPGIRLFYYKGEVEILSIGPEHEIFSRFIGTLLAVYFEANDIEYTPTGSFTQEKAGIVSARADESFFLGNLATTPDLSIEVVFTSGRDKLPRYLELGVPEVWFWEDGVFTLWHRRKDGYQRIDQSEVLPGLDLDLLTQCVLMAQTSRLDAVKRFRKGVRQRQDVDQG
jgi:Uma2 family endonuclease